MTGWSRNLSQNREATGTKPGPGSTIPPTFNTPPLSLRFYLVSQWWIRNQSFVRQTCLTPSCLWRGTGRDRNPRRSGWGRETIPAATLSPPEWLLYKDGQRWETFYFLIHCDGQKVTRRCPQTTTFEEKEEPKRGIEPMSSAYQRNTSPLDRLTRNQSFKRKSGAVWESRWSSELPVPNSSHGLCGRRATLNLNSHAVPRECDWLRAVNVKDPRAVETSSSMPSSTTDMTNPLNPLPFHVMRGADR